MSETYACDMCGNVNDLQSLHAIPTPDADQKYMLVCDTCLPSFENKPVFFKVLGGPTYTEENRPLFWSNDTSLEYNHFHITRVTRDQLPDIPSLSVEDILDLNTLDISQLPLEQFPLIEDFEIRLEKVVKDVNETEEDCSGYFVFFFSPSRGYLAYLLDCDACSMLCQDDFSIPAGDFQVPYFNFDWGWSILIAADDTYIYVLTGGEKDYNTWFKVEKKLYYQQWDQAIYKCKQICC
jgi:hypothetical protein